MVVVKVLLIVPKLLKLEERMVQEVEVPHLDEEQTVLVEQLEL